VVLDCFKDSFFFDIKSIAILKNKGHKSVQLEVWPMGNYRPCSFPGHGSKQMCSSRSLPHNRPELQYLHATDGTLPPDTQSV
jgi:hypothetical protein